MLRIVRQYSILAGLLLLATVWSIRPVSDIDVQWHLKIGSWMLEHHQVVRNDFYSISRWGTEWISIPWLYQCTLAWLVNLLGWLGPILWQWAVAMLITVQSGLLVAFFRRFDHWQWIWPALSLPAALGVLHVLLVNEVRFLHRPEMASDVFIPTFLLFLLLYSSGDARESVSSKNTEASGSGKFSLFLHRGGIWLLPVFQVIWANSHDLAVLGLILVWFFIGAAWLNAFILNKTQEKAGELVQISGVGFAVVGACFLSPYGWNNGIYHLHQLPVLVGSVFEHGISVGEGVSSLAISRAEGLNFLVIIGWIMVLVGLIGRFVEISRQSLAEGVGVRHWWKCFEQQLGLGYVLTCGFFLYISLTAVSNLPLFSLVAVPLMVAGLEYLADSIRWLMKEMGVFRRGLKQIEKPENVTILSVPKNRFYFFSRSLSYIFFFGLLAFLYQSIVSESYYERQNRSTSFGIGQSNHSFPLASMEFLEKNKDDIDQRAMLGDMKSATLFLNRFGPEKKVYIDSRSTIYDASLLSRYAAVFHNRGAFFEEAGKYGITLALFSAAEMQQIGGDLLADIYTHPGWALLHLDDSGVIFAARTPANSELISRYAMPPVPETMEEQNKVYLDWLNQTARDEYSLFDQANRDMVEGGFAGALVSFFRLGGLIKPGINRVSLSYSQTASLLSALGWTVVADSMFDQAAAMEPINVSVLNDSIYHAIACLKEAKLPEAKRFYLDRIRNRSNLLSYHHYNHPTALYGMAYSDMISGNPAPALESLLLIHKQDRDVLIMDMIARLYGEMGDLEDDQQYKEKYWKEAVTSWRLRLAKYPSGPDTSRAYLRLGDLFVRLNMPLLARANYMLALAEPDISALAAKRARQYIRQLDKSLFGGEVVDISGEGKMVTPFIQPQNMERTP